MIKLVPLFLLLLLGDEGRLRKGVARYLSNGGKSNWNYARYKLKTYPCTSNGHLYNCTAFTPSMDNDVPTEADALLVPSVPTVRNSVSSVSELSSVYLSSLDQTSGSMLKLFNPGDDWSAVNYLLQHITFTLPDFTQKVSIGTISVTAIRCGKLLLSDLAVNSTQYGNTKVTLTADLEGLQLTCSANWAASVLGIKSSGALTADSKGSTLKSALTFISSDLRRFPPSSSKSDECKANVVISDIHFTGGVTAKIINLFKSTVEGEIAKAVNPLLCTEISSIAGGELQNILGNLTKDLDPYLTPDALRPLDPLKPERDLERDIPAKELDSLSNLQRNPLLVLLRRAAVSLLGRQSDGTFGINKIVRNAFRDSDGVLNISTHGLPLFAATSDIVSIQANMTWIAIKGLDTFSRFNILDPISNFTLESGFAIDSLSIDAGVLLKLTAGKGELHNRRERSSIDKILTKIRAQSVSEVQHLVLSISGKKLSFNISALLALDGVLFGSLPLSSMYNDFVGCTLRTLVATNVSGLRFSVDNLSPFSISGFTSSGLDHVASELLHGVELMFYDSFLRALPALAQSVARNQLNSVIRNEIREESSKIKSCKLHPGKRPSGDDAFIDLSTSWVSRKARQYLRLLNVSTVNAIVKKLTKEATGIPGLFTLPGSLVSGGGVAADLSLGEIFLDVGNASFGGLDTFTNLTLFETPSPYRVENSFSIGWPEPLVPVVDLRLHLTDRPRNGSGVVPADIIDDMTLGVSLLNLSATIDIMLKIDKFLFDSLPMSHVTDLNCWATAVADIQFLGESSNSKGGSDLSVGSLGLNVSCNKCTSPLLPEFVERSKWVNATREVSTLVNSFIRRNLDQLETERVHGYLLNYVSSRSKLCAANTSVPAPASTPSTDTDSECFEQKVVVLTTAGILVTLGILASLVYHVRKWNRQKHGDNHRLSNMVSEADSNNFAYQKRTGASERKIANAGPLAYLKNEETGFRLQNERSSHKTMPLRRRARASTAAWVKKERDVPLLYHPQLPWCTRWGVVFFIFVFIGMFASGHASQGASVDLHMLLFGETVNFHTIYSFSLGSSLTDMWTACAIVLATLIGTFSGCWPYIKLLLMGVVWCLPPHTLSIKTRGVFIQLLDIMGKWSLIDLYVLVMSMIAFFVNGSNPDEIIFPSNFYDVNLWVTPVWGLYAFCFAVTGSLVLSHVQVVAHRNAVSADRQEMEDQLQLRSPQFTPSGKGTNTSSLPPLPRKQKQNSRQRRRSSWFDAGTVDLWGERKVLVNAKQSLCRHIFEVEGIRPIRRLGCNRCGKYTVLILPLLSLGLLLWGASITAFTFNIEGVAGFFQEFGHKGSSTTKYSLLDVTRRLLLQASKTTMASSFGIHFIAILYVCFAFIIPTCQLIGLVIMWVVPMKLSRMKRGFFALEILSSWGATEVFIIATVVAVNEISDISQKIVGDACDPLSPFFEALIKLGLINSSDGKCFEVGSQLNFGSLILLLAALTGMLSTQIITRLAEAAIEDRQNRIKGTQHDENLSQGCGHFIIRYFQKRLIGRCVVVIDGTTETTMSDIAAAYLQSRRSSFSDTFLDDDSVSTSSNYTGRRSSLSMSSTDTSDATKSLLSAEVGLLPGNSNYSTEQTDLLPPLPPGWTVVDTEETGVFYWNEVSGQIMRIRPTWTRKFPPRRIRIRTRTSSQGSVESRSSTPRNTPRGTPTRGIRQPDFTGGVGIPDSWGDELVLEAPRGPLHSVTEEAEVSS